jgi:threonine dehydrogenase-like Zn-dependent dehydrogenase
MKATFMYGAGDVRVETVPDPVIQQPTDAIVRTVRACICGSDLHPYHSLPHTAWGKPMGHELIGVVEETGAEVTGLSRGDFVIASFAYQDNTCVFCREGEYEDAPVGFGSLFGKNATLVGGPAPVRAYLEQALPDVLEGRINPGRVFDQTVTFDEIPDGYKTMDSRTALKVLVTP